MLNKGARQLKKFCIVLRFIENNKKVIFDKKKL